MVAEDVVSRDAVAADTMVQLIAALMEESFDVLGEGVIMGSMPKYLQAFGRRTARHLMEKHVDADPDHGAAASLVPLNSLSDVTATGFSMVESGQDRAVKRLHTCEFQRAFEGRGEFPKAMICTLHCAVYQGAVNASIEDEDHGYDVRLGDRILFGADHCDFIVESRAPRTASPDPAGGLRNPLTPDERRAHAYDFYTSILVAFIDYLCQHLPAQRVDAMLERCAGEVGRNGHAVMEAAGLTGRGAIAAARLMLTYGGRDMEPAEEDKITVNACPQAYPIKNTATTDKARSSACDLCCHVLDHVAQMEADVRVSRESSIAEGDDHCTFRIQDQETEKA